MKDAAINVAPELRGSGVWPPLLKRADDALRGIIGEDFEGEVSWGWEAGAEADSVVLHMSAKAFAKSPALDGEARGTLRRRDFDEPESLRLGLRFVWGDVLRGLTRKAIHRLDVYDSAYFAETSGVGT